MTGHIEVVIGSGFVHFPFQPQSSYILNQAIIVPIAASSQGRIPIDLNTREVRLNDTFGSIA